MNSNCHPRLTAVYLTAWVPRDYSESCSDSCHPQKLHFSVSWQLLGSRCRESVSLPDLRWYDWALELVVPEISSYCCQSLVDWDVVHHRAVSPHVKPCSSPWDLNKSTILQFDKTTYLLTVSISLSSNQFAVISANFSRLRKCALYFY